MRRAPSSWSWIAPSPGEPRNNRIDHRFRIPSEARRPKTSGLRAFAADNNWEYGDESVEIEVEMAGAPGALRAGSALCDARVADDLRVRPGEGRPATSRAVRGPPNEDF